MEGISRSSPWYLRWWGIAILAYLAVTAVLGIAFLVMNRRSRASVVPEVLRAGGFTAAKSTADRQQSASVDASMVRLVTDADPAIGAPAATAKLTIVEFSDFECPFCRQAFPIIRGIAAAYGDRGVRYVYRDFPVDALHANARAAAEAAQCAHAQGKFWAYHDKLFQNAGAPDANTTNGGGLDRASLARYARQVGLDQRFDVCLASGEMHDAVQRDVDAGTALGVHGTPTWFFMTGNDPSTARRVEGVIPREAFTQFLDRTLERLAR